MVYWIARAGKGDVHIEIWFEDQGVIVLDRQDGDDPDFTPDVAHNAPDAPRCAYAEPDPGEGERKRVPYQVNAEALQYGPGTQRLWHVARQGATVCRAVDEDTLDPIRIPDGQEGLPLDPELRAGKQDQRYFGVMFR